MPKAVRSQLVGSGGGLERIAERVAMQGEAVHHQRVRQQVEVLALMPVTVRPPKRRCLAVMQAKLVSTLDDDDARDAFSSEQAATPTNVAKKHKTDAT